MAAINLLDLLLMHNVMRIVAWGIVAFLYAHDVVLTSFAMPSKLIMTLTAIAGFNLLTAR